VANHSNGDREIKALKTNSLPGQLNTATGLQNMSCHREIIKQRVIDFGKAVAGCFSPEKRREAIIYLITGACSVTTLRSDVYS